MFRSLPRAKTPENGADLILSGLQFPKILDKLIGNMWTYADHITDKVSNNQRATNLDR